jgi:thioredoxin reductase (NADPH)
MTQEIKQTDVIIIGAGPVGLFSVFQFGMLNMKCCVVDALDFVGGQCKALYPEKPIYDIPAYPKISGEDLIDNLYKQIAPFNPQFELGESVIKLKKELGFWQIETSLKKIIRAKIVVISAGCGAFGPHKPPLNDLEVYEKSGQIQYHVSKKADLKGKNVVIAGGGDSAVDWALNMVGYAKSVTLIHRRNKFRCAPKNSELIKTLSSNGEIELAVPYQLHSLKGEGGKLTHVNVSNLDGAIKSIEADVLLPFFGLSMDIGPIAQWGLELDRKHVVVNQETMETNLKGVFAVGDIVSYPGKLKLILTGFSEAALAAHNAYKIVFPDTPLHFEYSTTKGIHTI